jgi:quinol monooxygenase YgiN
MAMKYGLNGKMRAKAGKGDELASILLEASRLVSRANGIGLYVVSKDANDPDVVHIMEAWDSQEDHDNSLKLDGVGALIARAMPLMEGKPDGTVLAIQGGVGVDSI